MTSFGDGPAGAPIPVEFGAPKIAPNVVFYSEFWPDPVVPVPPSGRPNYTFEASQPNEIGSESASQEPDDSDSRRKPDSIIIATIEHVDWFLEYNNHKISDRLKTELVTELILDTLQKTGYAIVDAEGVK